MYDKYKYMLLKFAASNIKTNQNIRDNKENIFKIQEIYSKCENNYTNNFCPILFFASYIDTILKLNNINIEYSKFSPIPIKITLDDLVLFINYRMNNLHITMLYIRYIDLFNKLEFNSKAYFAQYYDLIEEKYQSSKLNKYDLSALFYVEYGYWNKLLLKYINPLQYICSYPEFKGHSEDQLLKIIFEFNDEKLKLLFDPYIYVASNFEKLQYLIDDETVLPNSNNEVRIYNQYIRDGYKTKNKVNTFNYYNYLANNYKEIQNILVEDNCLYWNIYKLSNRNISLNYIKNYKNCKNDVFNAAKFVEDNVNDNEINFDNKLSIETAPKYFVINYVNSKKLRYHMSKRYRIGIFCSQRIKDTLRTLPLSITKCFYSFPI